MSDKVKWLKSTKNSRVFQFTDELQKRGDMVPCNAQGEFLSGHTVSSETSNKEIRKSKFVGFMTHQGPGILRFWTEQLSVKTGAIFVDDPAQWKGDVSNVVAPKPVALVEDEPEKEVVVKTNPVKPGALTRNVVVKTEDDEPVDTEADGSDIPIDPIELVVTGTQTEEPLKSVNANPELVVPDVSKLTDKNEARSVLCQWALNNFEVQLNRTYGPVRMHEECEKLLAGIELDKVG